MKEIFFFVFGYRTTRACQNYRNFLRLWKPSPWFLGLLKKSSMVTCPLDMPMYEAIRVERTPNSVRVNFPEATSFESSILNDIENFLLIFLSCCARRDSTSEIQKGLTQVSWRAQWITTATIIRRATVVYNTSVNHRILLSPHTIVFPIDPWIHPALKHLPPLAEPAIHVWQHSKKFSVPIDCEYSCIFDRTWGRFYRQWIANVGSSNDQIWNRS